MDKVKIKAKKRDVLGKKTNKFRKEGTVPAVVYGKKIKSQSLWVNELDIEKLLKKVGENTILDLEVEGEKENLNVIINELQRSPVRDNLLHVDFFRVKMDEKIETEVELIFVGESPAVKENGGILVKSLNELPIKCLPGDLPGELEVDISSLRTFEDRISVSDLKLSDKIEIMIDLETMVAAVDEPRSQEELESLEEKVEEDVTKVEGVEKEGDEEEGDEKNEKGEKKEEKPEKKEEEKK